MTMEENPLDLAWFEPNGDGDHPALRPPERMLPDLSEASSGLDARHRRGSLGPPPVAAPLDEAASGAVLHTHLVHLLDAGREAAPPPAALAGDAEQQLGPHDDLERQPDGVPHLVIGLTALFSVALAAILIGIFHSGAALGTGVAVTIAVIAIPLLVVKLDAKADRDRDHDHPSR
jgi:hypothetical protein